MKALRNPFVIIVLVGLALVVGYSRFRTRPVVVVPPEVKSERPLIVGPDASVELDKLGWTPLPTRDPFHAADAAAQVVATITDQEGAPVVDVLHLKAVWLQESGGWAVINGKVLGEGDAILDFRVEKILADGVLVQGPDGRRQLGFKPASARPPPSAAGAPSTLAKAPLKPSPGKPLILAQDSTAATGHSKSPEKSSP